jgi:hypothetical protein
MIYFTVLSLVLGIAAVALLVSSSVRVPSFQLKSPILQEQPSALADAPSSIEVTGSWRSYVHPNAGYSFAYPSSYTLLQHSPSPISRPSLRLERDTFFLGKGLAAEAF